MADQHLHNKPMEKALNEKTSNFPADINSFLIGDKIGNENFILNIDVGFLIYYTKWDIAKRILIVFNIYIIT